MIATLERGDKATRVEAFGFLYFSLNIANPMLEARSRRLQARIPLDGAG